MIMKLIFNNKPLELTIRSKERRVDGNRVQSARPDIWTLTINEGEVTRYS